MSKQMFNVGDRVEFVEDYIGEIFKGAQGTVVFVRPAYEWKEGAAGQQLVSVALVDGTHVGVLDQRLKLVDAAPEVEVVREFFFYDRGVNAMSAVPYATFEDALIGFGGFAQRGQETEIIEVISHGTYKASVKVEAI